MAPRLRRACNNNHNLETPAKPLVGAIAQIHQLTRNVGRSILKFNHGALINVRGVCCGFSGNDQRDPGQKGAMTESESVNPPG